MEASGAGQTADQSADETPDAQTAEIPSQEPTGNGIVVVCGIFEPGSVVELVERGPRDVRPGGAAVRGRRTVDENGEVGFAGLIPGDLFFVTGYVDGEFRPVRCVAQDPSSSITLMQPPEQAIPTQQGTAQTPVVQEPPAEPATATEGEGLPEGVTSPVLGSGDAQPQRYYLHNVEEEPDPAIWHKANVREQLVPADDSRTPNDLWVYAGSDEPVELGTDWTLYEGPTEPVPADEAAPDTAAEASAASSADATGPAQATSDGEAEPSDTAQVGTDASDTAPTTGTDVQAQAPVDEPNPPAPDAGTPDASESSGTGQANGGAVEEIKAGATAGAAEDAGAIVGDQAAGEAVADPQAAADANSPIAQTPAAETAWDKLVKQAEGLGVPNAAALSDAELRQSISEKSATPVV